MTMKFKLYTDDSVNGIHIYVDKKAIHYNPKKFDVTELQAKHLGKKIMIYKRP